MIELALAVGVIMPFMVARSADAQTIGTPTVNETRRARLEALIEQLIAILKQWRPDINWNEHKGSQ